jgi:hypothetical protein
MQVAPLVRYRTPGYPTALQIQACPDILKRHVPKSWLANDTVSRLLGVVLAANGSPVGCVAPESFTMPYGSNAGDGSTVVEAPESGAAVDGGQKPANLTRPARAVAPIFEHGNGVGSFGCVAVAPPVFLSEEEALEMVRAAIAAAGLDGFRGNVEHPQISISRLGFTSSCDSNTVLLAGGDTPLVSDLYRAESDLGIDFVSRDDFDRYAVIVEENCSVISYDLLAVAEHLRSQVAKKGDGIAYGVLYDPVTYAECMVDGGYCFDENSVNQAQELARQTSREQLRQQVQDLIAWFEAQGTI